MDAAELARLIRFAARGGIGKATAIEDRVAESSEDLMFIEDDEITVLMQTPENGDVYWGYCEGVVGKFQARDVRFHSPLKRAKRTFARTVEPIIEKPIIDDSVSSLVLDSRSVKITSKVVDSQGRTQGLLSRTMSGVWSVNPIDSDTMDRVFTVTLNDPLFQHEVLSGIHPCRHPDWNIPSRINILLEMLYWESRLSAADNFKLKLFSCIRRITRDSEMLPPSLYLRNLAKESEFPMWGGGYADIWKGQTANGDPICLKVLRVFTTQASRKKLFKEFSQEVLVWSQLEHPHVLPFLGISTDLFPESYCLVSPWCSHGSVMNYINLHPEVNRTSIIWDILEGLEYLHTRTPPVIHGDLKGANILVSELGHCQLADFGLSMSALQTFSSSTGSNRGSIRWMAPEMFYPTLSRPSMATDVYAFGSTVLEIMTGMAPYPDIKNEAAVLSHVMSGCHPSRPSGNFSDELWRAIKPCWAVISDRPTISSFRRWHAPGHCWSTGL